MGGTVLLGLGEEARLLLWSGHHVVDSCIKALVVEFTGASRLPVNHEENNYALVAVALLYEFVDIACYRRLHHCENRASYSA